MGIASGGTLRSHVTQQHETEVQRECYIWATRPVIVAAEAEISTAIVAPSIGVCGFGVGVCFAK